MRLVLDVSVILITADDKMFQKIRGAKNVRFIA